MSVFRKSFATTGAAQEALRRTARLRGAGLPTPDGRPGQTGREVAFDHVTGLTGFNLLEAVPMSALLVPLGALHDVTAGQVPEFDPLLRIRPRLGGDAPKWLMDALAQPAPAGAGRPVLLHGDFHVGQMICDGAGDIWLIDLDDLASGPEEADLGNFIAHLATSAAVARGGFNESIAFWQGEVLEGWSALGRGCEPLRLNRYLRLALIRRHLKLRAAGRRDYCAEIREYLSTP
ncbi:MAG: phosphotransferase [Albidovulum sp.]|uniref:phosphotransferase family protein n=1 Tax=Albidovulum sp. TaxID=1872424 RepID=UPI003CA7F582